MAQGVFVEGQRPKTKKALREAVQTAPESVFIEGTSIAGNEFDGRLIDAEAATYFVVGPDPYTARVWYAQVIVGNDGKVRVK